MITYELSLERQNLLGADKFSIAAESNETVSFRFHFDRSWRIFDTKAAVFKSSAGNYYVLDIRSNCVTVPWEVLRSTNGFELAVVAYENEVVLTSKKVSIAVSSSLLPENCRQLSPTETLFDRISEEARNAAFLEYRDEIQTLNRNHTNRVLELGEQIEAERSNTAAVAAQKDAEIAAINYQASVRENELQAQITELEEELEEKSAKAANWDLVNTALSQKTSPSNQLWSGGTQSFDLPMLNTSSITSFSSSNFSNYLASIGLNAESATTFADAFSNKTGLEEVRLINTENVTNMKNIFYSATHLRRAYLGNLINLNSLEGAFLYSSCVEYISMGNLQSLGVITSAFGNCRSLKEIDAVIDSTLCRNFSNTFTQCSSLETIRFVENTIKATIDFSACVNLTKDSIYNIANGLNSEVLNTNVTFSEHAFTYNLTSAEQSEIREIIRGKPGWTLMMS